MQGIIELYEEATLRATNTKTGLRFTTEDRKALVAKLEELRGFNFKDVAHAIAKREWDGSGVYNNVYGRHVGRLHYFLGQYGTLRALPEPEPEALPVIEEALPEEFVPMSTPVSAMVQKMVDELIETAVKYGVTSTHALLPYINRSIEKRKATQKVEQTTERLLEELRLTGLTREQMLAVLAAVPASL